MNKIKLFKAFFIGLISLSLNSLNSAAINPVLIPFITQRFVRITPVRIPLKPVIRPSRPLIINYPITLNPIIIGALTRSGRFGINFRVNF